MWSSSTLREPCTSGSDSRRPASWASTSSCGGRGARRRLLADHGLVPGGPDRHQEQVDPTQLRMLQREDLLRPRIRVRRLEGQREGGVIWPCVGALVAARQY